MAPARRSPPPGPPHVRSVSAPLRLVELAPAIGRKCTCKNQDEGNQQVGDMQLLEDTRTLFKIRSMLLQRLYDRISTITWKMRFAAAAHTI